MVLSSTNSNDDYSGQKRFLGVFESQIISLSKPKSIQY